MGSIDPKQIALQFSECINTQNIRGISNLMTEDHRFIDRAGKVVRGKENMIRTWVKFFELFPEY
jgi:ketosteroid isomerase-like protein